ncbi:MAG: hypothetical protein HOI95_24080 [Chromatiales bacterium]|nr:hypothetical protein [Chromatiales bacterium]
MERTAAPHDDDNPDVREEAISAGNNFGIDDVIDPRDTRALLIHTFDSSPVRRPDKSPPRFRPISPI